jgi:hypothetical protein
VIGRRIRKMRAARVKPDMEKEGENGNAER